MKRRQLTIGVITSLVSVMLTMVGLEITLRAIKLNPYGMTPRRVDIKAGDSYVPTAYWGTAPVKQASPFPGVTMEYIPRINFRFVYASNPRGYFDSDNAVVSQINSHGTRGPEFQEEKAPGSFRILGLGDSFTFGEGVRVEDTFLSRLQRRLNGAADAGFPRSATPDPGGKYEVINCGVSSFNTRDEVVYLEEKWIRLEPDLVLITFCINDGYDDAEFGPIHQGYVYGVTSRLDDLNKHPSSVLLAWASSVYERHRISVATQKMYLSQFSANPLMTGYAWENCRQMFSRAAGVTRTHNARLAIVIFPELFQLGDDYPFHSIHQQVKDEGARLGVPVLDLLDSFHGMDASTLWVHPTDHHPNEIAHRIAGDAIARFIAASENKLMEPVISK